MGCFHIWATVNKKGRSFECTYFKTLNPILHPCVALCRPLLTGLRVSAFAPRHLFQHTEPELITLLCSASHAPATLRAKATKAFTTS